MIRDSSDNLARLFVPYRKEDTRALKWRIALIEHHKLFSAERLVEIIDSFQKGQLDAEDRSQFLAYAKSGEIALDELEMTTLLVTGWLLKADTMTIDQLKKIHRPTGVICDGRMSSEYLRRMRSNLKRYGENLLKYEVQKVRAKLAVQEIAAIVEPNEFIPYLISLSPKYLGSDYVQRWIRMQQYNFHSEKGKSEVAARNLNRVSKAIRGDKRALKKRRYPYWSLGIYYEDLVGHIKGFRKLKNEGQFEQLYFEIFIEKFKIPENYPPLILDPQKPPGQLALDIMIAKEVIKDTKSFEEFHPYINRLQSKHFGGRILGVANDAIPVIADFLDAPSMRPELIKGFDPLHTLERVPLTFPRPNSH